MTQMRVPISWLSIIHFLNMRQYGFETWYFIIGLINRLWVLQRTIERFMLGIFLWDRTRNVEIRRRIRVLGITKRISLLKWPRVISTQNRWLLRSKSSQMDTADQRSAGLSSARWTDDLVNTAGPQWVQAAFNRSLCPKLHVLRLRCW